MGTLLDDSESQFFSCIANELSELAGEDINYWAMDRTRYKVDPLYGEPTQREVVGPFRVTAWFQWPNQEPEAGEHGFGFQFDSLCVISRMALDEQKAPYPFEGDVIEAWRTPYHDANSLGKGLFFDVVKVNNDGHVNDSPTFVQFKLYLKRRTQFGAERRLDPP